MKDAGFAFFWAGVLYAYTIQRLFPKDEGHLLYAAMMLALWFVFRKTEESK